MARILSDGAESGDVIAWTSSSGTSSNASVFRITGRGYRLNSTGALANTYLLPTQFSDGYARVAVYWESGNAMTISFRNGATSIFSMTRNASDTKLDCYVNGVLEFTCDKPLAMDTWYVIEAHMKIDDSTGVFEVKIDGVSQGSFSGDTKPGAITTIDRMVVNFTNAVLTLDDIAINDTSGAVDNSWCGDAHFYSGFPNGNGNSSNFTGSDGNSTDNYLLVDEAVPNSDTDYVQSATSGHKDLYAVGDLPALPSGSTIQRVVVEARARELTADGDSIYLGVRHSTSEAWSNGIVLGVSYARQIAEFLTNPSTGAAWTETEINAMQIGEQVP